MNDIETIRNKIHLIRGQQVMLDMDLAEMYGVETSQLKRTVRRNIERFPEDFMFQLNNEEFNCLKMSMRCQNGISYNGGLTYTPFAFTEHGVAMLSGVLRSATAIEVNIRIIRAFVAARQYLAARKNEESILEYRMKKLEDAFEETLRYQNDIDEDTRMRLDMIEETLASLVVDIRSTDRKKGRSVVKGFS